MPSSDDVSRVGVPEIGRFALFIGSTKSGTTSLFRYLPTHPATAPCCSKEPHIFADEAQRSCGVDG